MSEQVSVDLSGNKFTGELIYPASNGLYSLDVSSNNFNGPLTAELCQFEFLKYFYSFDNPLLTCADQCIQHKKFYGSSTGVESTCGLYLVDVFAYDATNTLSTTQNFDFVEFYICGSHTLEATTCNQGGYYSGDTYLRLFSSSSTSSELTEVGFNDDFCGVGSGLTHEEVTDECRKYSLRLGCFSAQTCEAKVAVLLSNGGKNSDPKFHLTKRNRHDYAATVHSLKSGSALTILEASSAKHDSTLGQHHQAIRDMDFTFSKGLPSGLERTSKNISFVSKLIGNVPSIGLETSVPAGYSERVETAKGIRSKRWFHGDGNFSVTFFNDAKCVDLSIYISSVNDTTIAYRPLPGRISMQLMCGYPALFGPSSLNISTMSPVRTNKWYTMQLQHVPSSMETYARLFKGNDTLGYVLWTGRIPQSIREKHRSGFASDRRTAGRSLNDRSLPVHVWGIYCHCQITSNFTYLHNLKQYH